MPNPTKRRLVLFNPSPWPNMPYFGLPLPLLAISALPREAGYPITIVVEDVDDDPEAQVLEACKDALVFGITSLTGHMIGRGLKVAAKVRERYPGLPIVWGGTHPSIAPEQTAEHNLVDIVVAGQGEATFMDLVDALDTGRPLDDVQGILFKRDGAIVKTGSRPVQHFENQVPWMLPEQVHFAKSNPLSMKALRGKDSKRFRRNKAKGAILYAYSAITRARYRHGYFKYAIEQKLMGMLARKVMASRQPDKQINGYLV